MFANWDAAAEEARWQALKARLDAEMEKRDIVEDDRKIIKEQPSTGASLLVLEVSASNRSHCKAAFCIPDRMHGSSRIVSTYRFNVKDITGERQADGTYYHRE